MDEEAAIAALERATAEEQRLRDLANTEGITRARAGEITVRQYKNDYYAPAIHAQFDVWLAEEALKDARSRAAGDPAAGEGAG